MELNSETEVAQFPIRITQQPRIKTLDSLRGIAASIVVIHHVCLVIHTKHSFMDSTPLYFFETGHEAVIFFFLLSGFVLTYQAEKQIEFSYQKFIFQRFFRIYIPYLFVIILTFTAFFYFHGIHKNNGNWIGSLWQKPLTAKVMISHLFLIGNFDTNFNPVIWSLVHEMRFSIVFPLILWITKFKVRIVMLTAIMCSVIAGVLILFNAEPSVGFNNSYVYTLHYLSIFIIGSLMSKHKLLISNWYNKLSSKKVFWLLALCLLFYTYSRTIVIIPLKLNYPNIALFNEVIVDWLVMLCAAYFIIFALHITNKSSWLLSFIPLKLGEISYSLYLVHIPVMIVFYNLLYNMPLPVVMAISVVVSVTAALIINKYIEKPAARIGKLFLNT